MVGPKKPPRLPIELIQAMPAAAAGPVRNIVGLDQNGPLVPSHPAEAIVMPTIAHQVPTVSPATTRPALASTQVQNRVQRRSPIRSDSQPKNIMLTAPAI